MVRSKVAGKVTAETVRSTPCPSCGARWLMRAGAVWVCAACGRRRETSSKATRWPLRGGRRTRRIVLELLELELELEPGELDRRCRGPRRGGGRSAAPSDGVQPAPASRAGRRNKGVQG